jgi:hypothetical protein
MAWGLHLKLWICPDNPVGTRLHIRQMDFKDILRRRNMRLISALKGAALGAGFMYLFDPELGQKRRDQLRDQLNSAVDRLGDGLAVAAHDFFPQATQGEKDKPSQGEKSRRGEEAKHENWPPATRMVAATVGGTLLSYAASKRFPIACMLGTVGLALVARATTNLEKIPQALPSGGQRSAGNHEAKESGERKPAKV